MTIFTLIINVDLFKIFMLYRHENEAAKGTKLFGFVNGINFKENCDYASTVPHDCHNLIVVGTSD